MCDKSTYYITNGNAWYRWINAYSLVVTPVSNHITSNQYYTNLIIATIISDIHLTILLFVSTVHHLRELDECCEYNYNKLLRLLETPKYASVDSQHKKTAHQPVISFASLCKRDIYCVSGVLISGQNPTTVYLVPTKSLWYTYDVVFYKI